MHRMNSYSPFRSPKRISSSSAAISEQQQAALDQRLLLSSPETGKVGSSSNNNKNHSNGNNSRMQRPTVVRKKIGSALAAFENNIQKNQQFASPETAVKSFLTGIASSSNAAGTTAGGEGNPSSPVKTFKFTTPKKLQRAVSSPVASSSSTHSQMQTQTQQQQQQQLPAAPAVSVSKPAVVAASNRTTTVENNATESTTSSSSSEDIIPISPRPPIRILSQMTSSSMSTTSSLTTSTPPTATITTSASSSSDGGLLSATKSTNNNNNNNKSSAGTTHLSISRPKRFNSFGGVSIGISSSSHSYSSTSAVASELSCDTLETPTSSSCTSDSRFFMSGTSSRKDISTIGEGSTSSLQSYIKETTPVPPSLPPKFICRPAQPSSSRRSSLQDSSVTTNNNNKSNTLANSNEQEIPKTLPLNPIKHYRRRSSYEGEFPKHAAATTAGSTAASGSAMPSNPSTTTTTPAATTLVEQSHASPKPPRRMLSSSLQAHSSSPRASPNSPLTRSRSSPIRPKPDGCCVTNGKVVVLSEAERCLIRQDLMEDPETQTCATAAARKRVASPCRSALRLHHDLGSMSDSNIVTTPAELQSAEDLNSSTSSLGNLVRTSSGGSSSKEARTSSSRYSASPLKRREQNALRKAVTQGLHHRPTLTTTSAPSLPQRQISDPDALPTRGSRNNNNNNNNMTDRASIVESSAATTATATTTTRVAGVTTGVQQQQPAATGVTTSSQAPPEPAPTTTTTTTSSAPTTTSVSATVAPKKQKSSSSSSGKKRSSSGSSKSSSKSSSGHDEMKKIQRELELRDQARKYNPSDHGLVGILNWTEKRKHLRVRFAERLVEESKASTRRASLDAALNDKSTVNSKASPRQPRRNSMNDMMNRSCHNDSSDGSDDTPELRKPVNPITKLRAAISASMVLPSFKCTRTWAAIRIQSFLKGYMQRKYYYPIMVLEHKLKQIEVQRQRELEDILYAKWKKMEQARYELESESRRIAETAEKAQMLIKYLREENTKIEARNQNVAESIDVLKKLNQQHSATTNLLLDNYSTMSLAFDALAEKNAKLLEEKAKYESCLETKKADLAVIEERAQQESKARENLDATLDKIIAFTQLRCDDPLVMADISAMHDCMLAAVMGKMEVSTCLRYLKHLPSSSNLHGSSLRDTEMAVRSFGKTGCSFRSDDTFSFAGVTVDSDLLTMSTGDSFASGWTQ